MSKVTATSDASAQPVAMIGLGIMGVAIAANLVRAGYPVHGFDPDPERMDAANAHGVSVRTSADECAADCAAVLTSLPSEAALDATVDALVAGRARLTGDATIIELSTLSIEAKEHARARLAAAGIGMLDCPVSGTGAQAITGDLTLFASGDESIARRMMSVLNAFARTVHYVGEFGNGMRLKLVANLLVAIHNVATAEALALARRLGLDAAQACELLGGQRGLVAHPGAARPLDGGRRVRAGHHEARAVAERPRSDKRSGQAGQGPHPALRCHDSVVWRSTTR